MRKRTQSLVSLPKYLKHQLQPYADLFEQVVVPEAARLNREGITQKTPGQVDRKIRRFLKRRLGFTPHGAITYYALRLCWHHYKRVYARSRQNDEQQRQLMASIDRLTAVLFERFKFTYL